MKKKVKRKKSAFTGPPRPPRDPYDEILARELKRAFKALIGQGGMAYQAKVEIFFELISLIGYKRAHKFWREFMGDWNPDPGEP